MVGLASVVCLTGLSLSLSQRPDHMAICLSHNLQCQFFISPPGVNIAIHTNDTSVYLHNRCH